MNLSGRVCFKDWVPNCDLWGIKLKSWSLDFVKNKVTLTTFAIYKNFSIIDINRITLIFTKCCIQHTKFNHLSVQHSYSEYKNWATFLTDHFLFIASNKSHSAFLLKVLNTKGYWFSFNKTYLWIIIYWGISDFSCIGWIWMYLAG